MLSLMRQTLFSPFSYKETETLRCAGSCLRSQSFRQAVDQGILGLKSVLWTSQPHTLCLGQSNANSKRSPCQVHADRMLWTRISKKRNNYLISDFSGFRKKNIPNHGVLESGQNHQMCPQGSELAVPSLGCTPPSTPAATVTPRTSGLSVQGAAPRPQPASPGFDVILSGSWWYLRSHWTH